jgi:hypothetical protein
VKTLASILLFILFSIYLQLGGEETLCVYICIAIFYLNGVRLSCWQHGLGAVADLGSLLCLCLPGFIEWVLLSQSPW